MRNGPRKRVKKKGERTFEERHQPPPASDGSFSVELTQRQLHVEQRDAPDKQHYQVRHQERTCWAQKNTFVAGPRRALSHHLLNVVRQVAKNRFKLFEIGFYIVKKCFNISLLSEFSIHAEKQESEEKCLLRILQKDQF